ncbi:MAG: hypothetical protein PHZ23_15220 [Acidiphilium sp.]|nr:hypothetical protein [Acidiphilium sp.]
MTIVQKRVGAIPERWRIRLTLVKSRDVELMTKLWPLTVGTLGREIRERLESSFGLDETAAGTPTPKGAARKRTKRPAPVIEYPEPYWGAAIGEPQPASPPRAAARAELNRSSGGRSPTAPTATTPSADDHVAPPTSDSDETIDEETLLMLRELDR